MIPRLLLFAIGAAAAACAPPRPVGAVYAHDTRELVRLDYDYNADGVIDVRTYMREGQPIRLEGDSNQDGLVDRWEYYGPNGALVRLGGSSRGDGREDTWVYRTGAETRVDLSTERDGIVDRREFFRDAPSTSSGQAPSTRSGQAVLLRTESDTNRDGLLDTWEQYDNGSLTAVMVDEDKRHGRPTRRLIYARGGGAPRIEMDPDGDGRFTAVEHESKEESHASR